MQFCPDCGAPVKRKMGKSSWTYFYQCTGEGQHTFQKYCGDFGAPDSMHRITMSEVQQLQFDNAIFPRVND